MKIASFALSVVVSLAVGCGSKAPPPVDKPGPPTPPPVALDLTQLGTECGAGDACQPGAACVKYYGIAGPSGPEFTSCEVSCADGARCPADTACITIADGPGAVCRPTEAPPPVAE